MVSKTSSTSESDIESATMDARPQICLLLSLSAVTLETKLSPSLNSCSKLQISTYGIELIALKLLLSTTLFVEFLSSKPHSTGLSMPGRPRQKNTGGHLSELLRFSLRILLLI